MGLTNFSLAWPQTVIPRSWDYMHHYAQPSFWISDPQNCKITGWQCFKPLNVWYFVTAAMGIKYKDYFTLWSFNHA
jgi:hypothetical protein